MIKETKIGIPVTEVGDHIAQSKVAKASFIKADSGKLQWSLMPFEELKDVVKVLMRGAKK